MNSNCGCRRHQPQMIDLLLIVVIIAAIAGTITFSLRYLPPIYEMPPFEPGNPRQGRNWFGQGGCAFAGYAFLLLTAAYVIKWFIWTRCEQRQVAAYLFALL